MHKNNWWEKKVNDERRNKAKKIPEKEKNSKRKKIMLETKGLGFRQLTTTWWLQIFEYKNSSWSYYFQNKLRFGKAVLLLDLALIHHGLQHIEPDFERYSGGMEEAQQDICGAMRWMKIMR